MTAMGMLNQAFTRTRTNGVTTSSEDNRHGHLMGRTPISLVTPLQASVSREWKPGYHHPLHVLFFHNHLVFLCRARRSQNGLQKPETPKTEAGDMSEINPDWVVLLWRNQLLKWLLYPCISSYGRWASVALLNRRGRRCQLPLLKQDCRNKWTNSTKIKRWGFTAWQATALCSMRLLISSMTAARWNATDCVSWWNVATSPLHIKADREWLVETRHGALGPLQWDNVVSQQARETHRVHGGQLKSFGPVKSTEKSKALGMSKAWISLSLGITQEYRQINWQLQAHLRTHIKINIGCRSQTALRCSRAEVLC